MMSEPVLLYRFYQTNIYNLKMESSQNRSFVALSLHNNSQSTGLATRKQFRHLNMRSAWHIRIICKTASFLVGVCAILLLRFVYTSLNAGGKRPTITLLWYLVNTEYTTKTRPDYTTIQDKKKR